jgi:uncharacterized membrane protein (DUF4010 family)
MQHLTKSIGVRLLAVIAILLLVFPKQADAYLDPGTGSMLWQVLLAVILAVGYVARRYWAKIRGFFGKGRVDDEGSEADELDS